MCRVVETSKLVRRLRTDSQKATFSFLWTSRSSTPDTQNTNNDKHKRYTLVGNQEYFHLLGKGGGRERYPKTSEASNLSLMERSADILPQNADIVMDLLESMVILAFFTGKQLCLDITCD